MAFIIRDLSVLAYANGFTLWHYKTGDDSLSDVACEDYFADASDMMASGDMILISGGTDGGNVNQVVQIAERIAPARPQPRFGGEYKMPVIYAGNKDAAPIVQKTFAARSTHATGAT